MHRAPTSDAEASGSASLLLKRTASAPSTGAQSALGADGYKLRPRGKGPSSRAPYEAGGGSSSLGGVLSWDAMMVNSYLGRTASQRTLSSDSDIYSTMPLANELLLHIFSFVDTRTLSCYCSSVCRAWRQLVLMAIKDREVAQHETFMLTHAQTHVECNSILLHMDYHLAQVGGPLVVVGESGSGKSTVLTHWILRHCRQRADTMIIYHFIGTPAHSTDYLMILYRMMCLLRFHGGINEDVPTQRSHLINKFPTWLSMAAASRPIIIVLDGLDQLDEKDSAQGLAWLPTTLPPNVQMVLSTRNTNATLATELFEKRRWKDLPLNPLGPLEKSALTI